MSEHESSEHAPRKAVLVRQPHGGALLQGPNDGHGGGSTPSIVRAALRESGMKRIALLEQIADDPKQATRDRIDAIKVLFEHGMRGNISYDDVRAAVIRTLEVIQAAVDPDIAEMLIRKIRPIWRTGGGGVGS
jgi:hypothetical protein